MAWPLAIKVMTMTILMTTSSYHLFTSIRFGPIHALKNVLKHCSLAKQKKLMDDACSALATNERT